MSCLELREYEIIPVKTYEIIRNCAGCGCKSTYHSTNKFRVNANGSQIDVWLIYQCRECKHTYNLTIYKRIKPDDIASEEYRKLLSNDPELALTYGLDRQLMTKNKAEIEQSAVSYQINSQISQETFLEKGFLIKNPYHIKIRVDKVISEILHISRNKIDAWIKSGMIHVNQNHICDIIKVEWKGGIMMGHGYLFEKDYKDNEDLRKSFHTLAEHTFKLNLESWYQDGYWQENYIPYSMIDKNQVVANVSVNLMKFMENGKEKNYIQLGTVMTEPSYRNQGLSKSLIEKVIRDYGDQVNGFYLFANDSVLEFYPKLGFRKSREYQYVKQVRHAGQMQAVRCSMETRSDREVLETAMKNSVSNAAFQMIDNPGLIMFYLTKFMKDCVYYIEEIDTYVIAEIEEERLLLHHIFAKKIVDLDLIIAAFGSSIRLVILGFTPHKPDGFELREVQEGNTTLFVMGKDLETFETKKFMFPVLSHA